MATGDDTQKLPIHQQSNEGIHNIKSRLAHIVDRIKFLLDLLGDQPDKPFNCNTTHLAAELISLQVELESVQGLLQQQFPDAVITE